MLALSSEVFQPGAVDRKSVVDHTTFILGELHGGITPLLQELQQTLSAAGKTELTTNIWGCKWAKLVYNALSAPISALLGMGVPVFETPEQVLVGLKLGQEALRMGEALGCNMEPVFGLAMEEAVAPPEALVENFARHEKTERIGTRGFMGQDVAKGRRTEVNYINGLVSEKGREVGIPTPMSDAATVMVKRLERREIRPNPSNIKVLVPFA